MICPTCNKEIEDGVLVCEYCGQEFVYEEYEEEEAVSTETEEMVETVEKVKAVETVEEKEIEEIEEVEIGEKSPKGFSITAFVCAICGAVFALTPAGIVLAILALVFNSIYNKKGGEPSKMTKATKIVSLVALIVSGVVFVVGLLGGSIFAVTNWDNLGRFFKRFGNWLEDFPKLFRVFR